MTTVTLATVDFTVLEPEVRPITVDVLVSSTPSPLIDWTFSVVPLSTRHPFQRCGTEISIDRGAGLQVVPRSKLGAEIVLKESLDGFADELRFSLVGEEWSPWRSDLIRGKVPVRARIAYGPPGAEHYETNFDGYFSSAEWDQINRVASITALDGASLYSEKKISYSAAPNAGLTRAQHYAAIVALIGIPEGDRDLGPGGDVVITKAVTVGEARPLDYLRQFVEPCGVLLWVKDGALQATRYLPSRPVEKTLNARDLCAPLTVTLPPTTDANTVSVVAVKFSAAAAEFREETFTDEITEPYAKQVWINMQDSSGTITPNLASPPPVTTQVTRRTITHNRWRGNILVFQEITEWAWYAPQAARYEFHSDGTIHPRSVNVYEFPDETWRSIPEETWRIVNYETTSVLFDTYRESLDTTPVTDFVVYEQHEKFFYHFIEKAIYQVTGGVETYVGGTIPLSDSGQGLVYGEEVIGLSSAIIGPHRPDSATSKWRRLRETTLGTHDGVMTSEVDYEFKYSSGLDRAPSQEGAYVYGVSTKQYKSQSQETVGLAANPFTGVAFNPAITKTTTYRQLDEDTLVTTTVTTAANALSPVRETATNSGSVPYAPHMQPSTTSQEVRATVRDTLRISINGEVRADFQNEFCENMDDLHRLAQFKLWDLSSWKGAINMPIEGQMHKDQVHALDIATAGIDMQRLHVWGVERHPHTYRETLNVRYIPAEVDSL